MERTERVPHSHSLDGGYGVKSNATPKLNQQPSDFQFRKVRKKLDTTPAKQNAQAAVMSLVFPSE